MMDTTVPVTQVDWIEALIDEACAPLTAAGLIPTRVLVPVRSWWIVQQSARRDGMRFAVGIGYVELVVASSMPEEPVVVAYAD